MSRLYQPRRYPSPFGGMNLLSAETKLRDYEYEDGQNLDIDIDGSVRSRAGHQLVGAIRNHIRDLVSWWRMEEGSGVRRDYAQGRNHLAVAGTVATGTGNEGSLAADVQAGTLARSSATQTLLSPTDGVNSGFSVVIWVKMNAGISVGGELIHRGDVSSDADSWSINFTGVATVQAQVRTSAGLSTRSNTVPDVSDGSWHMVALIWDGSSDSLSMSLDGGTLDTLVVGTAMADSAYDLVIGDTAFDAEVLVDDVQYYDRVLDATDCSSLWASGAGGTATFIDNGLDKTCRGLFQLKPSPTVGAFEELGVFAGWLARYELSDAAWVPIPMPSNVSGLLDPDARWTFTQLNNRAFMGNAVDDNMRYDGSLVLQLQGIPDTGTDVVSTLGVANVGGNVEEGFDYAYKLVNIQQVGGGRLVIGRPASVASAAVTVATASGNDRITIGTFPTAPTDPRVTHWGLYRVQMTEGAGDPANEADAAFEWIVDLPIATTSYDDDISQVSAAATGDNLGLYFEFRNVPKTKYRRATTNSAGETILYLGDPDLADYLYVSDPDYPDMSRADFVQIVGRDDGDPLTGIGALFDALILFKEDSFFIFTNTFDGTIFPYRFAQSHAEVGAVSGYCITQGENRLWWFAEQGWYELRGVDAFGNVRVRRISARIQPLVTQVQGTARENVLAVYVKRAGQNQLRVAMAEGSGIGNATMLPYDPDHLTPDPETRRQVGAWPSVWRSSKLNGFEALAVVENSSGISEVWVGDADGVVYRQDTGIDDDGDAIAAFLLTKHYDHGYGRATKRNRQLIIDGQTRGGALTLEWNNNYGQKPGDSKGVDMRTDIVGGDVWGTAIWGEAIYGGEFAGDLVSVLTSLYKATGHAIQLRFSSASATVAWSLAGWQFGFIPIPSHRLRRA